MIWWLVKKKKLWIPKRRLVKTSKSIIVFKVTAVLQQKKNPHRFNIFLDGQFAFGVDEDTVVSFRLIPGKKIDQSKLSEMLFEASVGELMERMYGLLARRARSQKEILDYLKALSYKRKIKGQEEISELVQKSLIDKLKQNGLINDSEFAAALVESRKRKKGIIALKFELLKKGISKEDIDLVLNNIPRVEQELSATSLLQKRLPKYQNLDKNKCKQKSLEYLLRLGFEYELAAAVVEKLIGKLFDKQF